MNQRRIEGALGAAFQRIVIAHGRAALDAAWRANGAGFPQQCLGQAGFARSRRTDQGQRSKRGDFRRRGHVRVSFAEAWLWLGQLKAHVKARMPARIDAAGDALGWVAVTGCSLCSKSSWRPTPCEYSLAMLAEWHRKRNARPLVRNSSLLPRKGQRPGRPGAYPICGAPRKSRTAPSAPAAMVRSRRAKSTRRFRAKTGPAERNLGLMTEEASSGRAAAPPPHRPTTGFAPGCRDAPDR